jgi:uncharacterized membrane protein YphA (DoxX/SURF4 family)
VICGLALVLGLLSRWAAAALLVLRLGAIGIFALQDRFSFPEGGGFEEIFAIPIICLAVILLGGGNLALDQLSRGDPKA